MKRKIYNFWQFVNENHTSLEDYIKLSLKYLSEKLEKMFSQYELKPDGSVKKEGQKTIGKDKSKVNFGELGLHKEDIEMWDNYLELCFSEEGFFYNFRFNISLEDIKKVVDELKNSAKPEAGAEGQKEKEKKPKDFDPEKVPCTIRFTKYSEEDPGDANPLEEVGVEIGDIDEEYLVELKLKLDEFEGEEEFEIETEE